MIPRAAALFEKLPRPLRRHRLMTAWMRLTREDTLQLVRIRDDSFGYADMSDGFLRLIVIDGDFEKDFFNLADTFLVDGGVFLDVGANHGLLSFGLAGKHGDRVDFHLFEPNPKLIASIRRSIALYPGMRCTVNQAAVADQEGIIPFFFDDRQSGASHIWYPGSMRQTHGPHCSDNAWDQVIAITLDRYLEKAGIGRVELLKMDVEGYELVALHGAKQSLQRQAIHAVYFEYFEKWLIRVQPPHELLAFLQLLDYEVCFCRSCDTIPRGGATHTIREGLPGHGLALLPVRGQDLPEMTDLLAVPKGHIIRVVR